MKIGEACSIDRCDRNLAKLREFCPYGSRQGRTFYLAMLSILASTTDEELWDQALAVVAGAYPAGPPTPPPGQKTESESKTV